jgi:D-cysteine desulfhydrase
MQLDPFELKVPSPVRRLMVEGSRELWLKDDSLVCPIYGGNKPRKLVRLLSDAIRLGARRLVTVGALGSHHVLATGLLGRHVGLPTTAVALPRPYSEHAEQTAIDTLAAGVELVPLGSPIDLARLLPHLWRRGDYWVAPGGSNARGALGYVDAVSELKLQIQQRQLPQPDFIVVALGSGGTAAGLLAGITRERLATRLVAVSVLHIPLARRLVLTLARGALREGGGTLPDFSSQLTVDNTWIGKGYGHSTAAGELAMAEASSLGLSLEATYTAKSFASALSLYRATADSERILFWSTFSAVSLARTTSCAVTLPSALKRLFRSTDSRLHP